MDAVLYRTIQNRKQGGRMTREEAIAIIENEKKCVNRANKNDYCNRDCYNCELVKTDTEILEALDMAIKTLETWDNLFKSYEVLTKEITENEDIKNATKRIDDWCIEQLRGIIGDYYADSIIKENEI